MFWILITAGVAAFIYFKLIRPFSYWSDKGVPQHDVWTTWKRLFQAFVLLRRPPAEGLQALYNSFQNYRYAGMYQLFRPSILLRDPDLIKQITVKDFDHFADRSQVGIQDSEPLWQRNLVSLKGDQWRDMRATLSPSFTSSKMKGMFGLICTCAEQAVRYFEEQASTTLTVETKDAFTRFTNDVIASVAFGVQCDSLKDPENEFYTMGKKATNFAMPKFILLVMFPRLAKLLGVKLFSDDVSSFFGRIIRQNMAEREQKGIIRPDMIHLLMEAKKGRLKHEKRSSEDEDGGFAVIEESNVVKEEKHQKEQLTDDDITAQAFMFFLAGFDTVSAEMAFMAYELAVNPDIQGRLQSEIDETFNNLGGSLTYDALVKMKYLDMVLSETLRKWPASAVMDRVCVKPYTIQPVKTGEKPAHLNVGDHLMLPIYGIHRDPQNYPDPDRFDPERFNDENKSKIHPYSYLVFGTGPRSCIGNRFALLEIKVVFFYLLSKFDVIVVDKTVVPLKLGSNPITLSSEGGVWLGLKRRKV